MIDVLTQLASPAMAWLVVVVFAAFTVEAAAGFGATLVTVALGAFALPIELILPAFVPVNVALSATLAARGRADVDVRLLLRGVLPAVAVGMPVGYFGARLGDPRTLKLAFGVFVVALGSFELLRSRASATASTDEASTDEAARPIARTTAAGLLGLGGVAHGAFATGGPMIVYVLGRTLGDDKSRFRATLSALWLVLNGALALSYAADGSLDRGSLARSVTLVPALAAGLWLGERIHARIHGPSFRRGVFALLVAAGAVTIARNL